MDKESKIKSTYRIDTHLAVGIKRKATQENKSQGEVVRDALRQYLS